MRSAGGDSGPPSVIIKAQGSAKHRFGPVGNNRARKFDAAYGQSSLDTIQCWNLGRIDEISSQLYICKWIFSLIVEILIFKIQKLYVTRAVPLGCIVIGIFSWYVCYPRTSNECDVLWPHISTTEPYANLTSLVSVLNYKEKYHSSS